jgi:hypothetical protein
VETRGLWERLRCCPWRVICDWLLASSSLLNLACACSIATGLNECVSRLLKFYRYRVLHIVIYHTWLGQYVGDAKVAMSHLEADRIRKSHATAHRCKFFFRKIGVCHRPRPI